MNINKEQIDDINIVVSVQIGKDDYEPKVSEILRDYRRKANMPGFRPGKVPEGLIRKMYGKAVMVDEINKLVSESLQNYIKEQDLKTLGDPLPTVSGEDLDWEIGNDFMFNFEMGLAPAINIQLSKNDQLVKYQIMVDQKIIDDEIENYAGRFGHFVDVDAVVDFKEKLTGDIVQLADNGQPLPDGLSANDTSMLVDLIKNEENRKPFENAKTGDEIVFNLSQTYPNEWEVASILKKKDKNEVGDVSHSLFRFTVKNIQKYVHAEVNQELFDQVFGKGIVADRSDFENRIRENFAWDFEETCTQKFGDDVREFLVNKINPALPEEFLLKWLTSINREVEKEAVEKEFPQFLSNMKWELIANAFIQQYGLKVEEQEIIDHAKTATRQQFSAYGLRNVNDEMLTKQAMSFLKDEKNVRSMASQTLERKIAETVIEIMDVQIREISLEDFNKMIYAQKYGEIGEAGEIGETGETIEIAEENKEAEKVVEIEEIEKDKEPKKRSRKKKEVEEKE